MSERREDVEPKERNVVVPEQAPDYWTDERLRKARPIDMPEGPPRRPEEEGPAEGDDRSTP